MKKKRILSLLLAVACVVSLLAACGSTDTAADSKPSGSSDHPVITMNAPYRNMSAFLDKVHEKYPDINLEIIPYNGQNTSAYMKDMRLSGEMPDIYFTTFYNPGRYDDAEDFLDMSGYDFTGNFVQSRLREVTLDGGIYMLPMGYNALGITYNKTLLEKNGWELPTNLEELAAMKDKVEAAGYIFCRDQLEYPGYGFQFLCNIADTGFLSTIEGMAWQEKFITGETTVKDTPEMLENLQLLSRWKEIGMLNGEGTPNDDNATKKSMAEGNILFLVGNSNDISAESENLDEFRLMPYLSEDGKQNVFILNVSRYVGLNKALGDEGNEKKLEDVLHVMEVLSTVEGMQSLEPSQVNSRMLPLKEYAAGENSYYADVIEDLNSGHTAPFIYTGWENIAVALGEKMIDYACDRATLDDVIRAFDDNQKLIVEDQTEYYTTVTERLDTEDCAKLVGICFAQATGSDAALISLNDWQYDPEAFDMNQEGVSGSLFPLPVSDEELVSILPTGWRDNIQTVTLTGARIKELAETGYARDGNSVVFPYVLVTKEGTELDDSTTYQVAICGATEAVQTEGNLQDSGVMGLEAAQKYFSQFETLSKKDIIWE